MNTVKLLISNELALFTHKGKTLKLIFPAINKYTRSYRWFNTKQLNISKHNNILEITMPCQLYNKKCIPKIYLQGVLTPDKVILSGSR